VTTANDDNQARALLRQLAYPSARLRIELRENDVNNSETITDTEAKIFPRKPSLPNLRTPRAYLSAQIRLCRFAPPVGRRGEIPVCVKSIGKFTDRPFFNHNNIPAGSAVLKKPGRSEPGN